MITIYLRVKEESRTKKSSEEEENAYEEDRRQTELVPLPTPVSFNRFGFHLDCVGSFLV